jgi:RNA polymerase sigma factor (sigma-70 family)
MNNIVAFSAPDNSTKPNVTQTVKKYGVQLLNFIKGKVKTLEDAEDVLQDVWFQLSNLSSLDELESVSGWLYHVARNRIIDLYRKKKPESLEDLFVHDEESDYSIMDFLLLDDTNNPELALFKELFWQQLMDALDELPPQQRQTFILNELEDKTLQEIADLQGENLKTVISRKGYAIKHLRKRLDQLYKELYQQ